MRSAAGSTPRPPGRSASTRWSPVSARRSRAAKTERVAHPAVDGLVAEHGSAAGDDDAQRAERALHDAGERDGQRVRVVLELAATRPDGDVDHPVDPSAARVRVQMAVEHDLHAVALDERASALRAKASCGEPGATETSESSTTKAAFPQVKRYQRSAPSEWNAA